MHYLPVAIAVLFLVAFMGAVFYLQYLRARSLLESWAVQNGFEILQRKLSGFDDGRFCGTSYRAQFVWRFAVRDHQGRVLNGYLRCGGPFVGVLSSKTEVRW